MSASPHSQWHGSQFTAMQTDEREINNTWPKLSTDMSANVNKLLQKNHKNSHTLHSNTMLMLISRDKGQIRTMYYPQAVKTEKK